MAHEWILVPEFVEALPLDIVPAGELPFHRPHRYRHDALCDYTVNERYDIILYCINPNNEAARPSLCYTYLGYVELTQPFPRGAAQSRTHP